MKLFYERIKW